MNNNQNQLCGCLNAMKVVTVFILCVCSFAKSQENCQSYSQSCDECIRALGCGWDRGADFKGASRCLSPSDSSKISKPENFYYPENILNVLEMRPVSEDVKFSPQKLKVTLRLHEAVFFTINLKDADAFPPQRLENILVEYTRDQPTKVQTRIEAISCPKDPKKFTQNLELTSYQSNQTLSVEMAILCSCP